MYLLKDVFNIIHILPYNFLDGNRKYRFYNGNAFIHF